MRTGFSLEVLTLGVLAVGCMEPATAVEPITAPAPGAGTDTEMTNAAQAAQASAVIVAPDDDDDRDPTPEELEAAIPVAATQVARVLVRGNELTFYALTDDAVTVREVAGTTGVFAGTADSGLAIYLDLTPATAPVPRALYAAEPSPEVRARVAGRTLVERVSLPITASAPAAAAFDQLVAATPVANSSSSWCSGATSQSFRDDLCFLTNWDVDYCHNGTWHSVTDKVGSSNKKHSSRSITLGCGANGHVRHYYKAGAWYKPIDEVTPSGHAIQWTYNGGWPLRREINHSRTTNSSFVRAVSHFNH